MTELDKLVAMSRYAGERFDLVQAAGGNTSVKYANDEMIIKASGYLLSEVSFGKGYSRVVTSQVAQIVHDQNIVSLDKKRDRETSTAASVREATLDKDNRPSIETILHSLLLKYTLHTHPLAVVALSIRKDWKELAQRIFNDHDVALVGYFTPGIELALAMYTEIQKFERTPAIIILQNHGLIINSDDYSQINQLTEMVVKRIEDYLRFDLSEYKLTNQLTKIFNEQVANDNISYLVEDQYLNVLLESNIDLFYKRACCPDTFVYCGFEVVDLNKEASLTDYIRKYNELPKVVLLENRILISAITIKKAKETEEVLKLHLMTLKESEGEVNHLSMEELAYLGNWEAEKFRQKK